MNYIPSAATTNSQCAYSSHLHGRRIAFTTPTSYSPRLIPPLLSQGALPVSCPTIIVLQSAPQKIAPLDSFKGIAFTSRSGIESVSRALASSPAAQLQQQGDEFLVGALGSDAELIQELKLFTQQQHRVKLVVPEIATPEHLADQLGGGNGMKLLCPVPKVVDLDEPRVVPDFMESLRSHGWEPVRFDAYVTRWAGPDCIYPLLTNAGKVDALVITSTAEVQGLLKSLHAHNLKLTDIVGDTCILVAYGPVTAAGARQLGVEVDLVGSKFQSFQDLVRLLGSHFESSSSSSASISSSSSQQF